jgi:hypothetical protein
MTGRWQINGKVTLFVPQIGYTAYDCGGKYELSGKTGELKEEQ